MKIRFEHIVFILFLLSMAGHGTAQENAAYVRTQEELLARDPDDTGALERLMFHHLHKADYRKAIDYGERLLDIGYARQDYHRSVLYAHIGLGQAYTMLGDSAAYNHLGQARINAENARNDSALCSVYNGLGLYAYNLDNDPYSAQHYFFLGLDAAQRSQYEKLRAILLANIANVYYIQRDTVGLKYSLQTYELGHRQNSPHLIYIGASTTAYMYFPSPSVADDAEKKYVNSPLTDEKKHVLFQNLEHYMTDQGIYRDKLLTKEKVADLLGTNRTYLSQVINEQTGQTFTQYVNRYRLDEAIRLLGDPQADITLKGIASDVGFSSMTTFYKVFQTNVGMSPKEYREKALHLSSGTDEAD